MRAYRMFPEEDYLQERFRRSKEDVERIGEKKRKRKVNKKGLDEAKQYLYETLNHAKWLGRKAEHKLFTHCR